MSSKSSIILTRDGEHWYNETNEPHFDADGKFIGYTIYVEISKKNIEILEDDSQDLIIKIEPGCELHELVQTMKQT